MIEAKKPVNELLPVCGYIVRGLAILSVLVLIHAVPAFLSVPNKAQQAGARAILTQMNQEQQDYYAERQQFLNSSNHLSTYMATYTSHSPSPYRYFTEVKGNVVYSYAAPIKEYPFGRFFIFPWNRFIGLKSYIGMVLVTDNNSKATQSTICSSLYRTPERLPQRPSLRCWLSLLEQSWRAKQQTD